ncbi:MAG: type VI secretion system baseplate subunit TssG [Thiolinea sp.]
MSATESLLRDSPRWSFYAALRELECHHAAQPRLGRSRRPVDERVRLGQEPSTLFAPSTLYSAEHNEQGLQLKVLFWHVRTEWPLAAAPDRICPQPGA